MVFYTATESGLKRVFHLQCAHDAGLISFGDD